MNNDPFERTFKNKADRMRIAPSDQAWNKLNRELSGHRQHQSIFSLSNLGIAASLLLLCTFSILFYLNSSSKTEGYLSTNYEVSQMEYADTKSNLSTLEINKIYRDLLNRHSGGGEIMKVN